MEVIIQLLTVGLAVVTVIAAAYRRHSRHVHTTRTMPRIVVVRDGDVARRLIIDHADSLDHPILPLGIDLDAGHPKTTSITSAPYGPLWRALRRNLTVNILHPSRVRHLQAPLQRDAVESLVAGLSAAAKGAGGDEAVAVRDALYASVFTTVARLCLGASVGDRDVRSMQRLLRDFFHSDVDATLLLTSRWARFVHWRKWRELLSTRRRLGEAFGPVITARRLSRGGDGICSYLDSLLDVRVPDDKDHAGSKSLDAAGQRALRDDEIVKLIWEFLGASTEAVVASVEWTLARLVTEPEVQKKLQRELSGEDRNSSQMMFGERLRDMPPYLRAVILESLRLHPPLPLLVRDVGPEGPAVAGMAPLPDGAVERFLFDAEEIGRDPKAWMDPGEFRPERFLAGGEAEDVTLVPGRKEIKMVPFGAGRRHCPGAELSMAHIGGIVGTLVREFQWAPPPAACGAIDLTAINALFVKVMASPLRARITPRMSRS